MPHMLLGPLGVLVGMAIGSAVLVGNWPLVIGLVVGAVMVILTLLQGGD